MDVDSSRLLGSAERKSFLRVDQNFKKIKGDMNVGNDESVSLRLVTLDFLDQTTIGSSSWLGAATGRVETNFPPSRLPRPGNHARDARSNFIACVRVRRDPALQLHYSSVKANRTERMSINRRLKFLEESKVYQFESNEIQHILILLQAVKYTSHLLSTAAREC